MFLEVAEHSQRTKETGVIEVIEVIEVGDGLEEEVKEVEGRDQADKRERKLLVQNKYRSKAAGDVRKALYSERCARETWVPGSEVEITLKNGPLLSIRR